MKGRNNRWQHRLNRERPTCTERANAHNRVRMEGWRQKRQLGVKESRSDREGGEFVPNYTKRVDTDRPSHGRPMRSLRPCVATSDAGCIRIQKIPGISPVVATAIVAAIGNGAAFRKGREFSAWLGIVPQAVLHRRQGAPSGHKQTRKHLPAEDSDPWRTSRCASYHAGPSPHRCLDGCTRTPCSSQRSDCSDGQQAGKNRLGSLVERRRVPTLRSCQSRGIIGGHSSHATFINFLYQGLHRNRKRRQNSPNDVPQPCNRKWPATADDLSGKVRAQLIMARSTRLRQKG